MTKPTQLMPELLILRDMADTSAKDFSHAPTTRAAIDKERIEELEAEVERLTQDSVQWNQQQTQVENDNDCLRADVELLRARVLELEDYIGKNCPAEPVFAPEEGNRVKPGFDIDPIR